MEGFFILIVIAGGFWAIAKLFSAYQSSIEKKAQHLFDRRKRELESEIEKTRVAALKEIAEKNRELSVRENYIKELKHQFSSSFLQGRGWLANYIAEADKALDDQLSNYLHKKKHPAHSAAEIVKEVKAEKREAMKRLKYLQFQLESYKEYFPFLEEFEDEILNEDIDFNAQDVNDIVDEIDRTILFLSKEEFAKLSTKDRNQLALDRYIDKHKKNWEIGRFYERFLGYKYEADKWSVSYIGAVKGYEDMGRDLICTKDGKTHIVQAKCWSAQKTIHEKHIFQLFGTTLCYEMENNLPAGLVTPVFTTTSNLSDVAKVAAERLGVIIKQVPLEKRYAMIKCNVNQDNKIYHLPFDQQYDRVKIQNRGEFYCETVEEAERKGFRRAKRHFVGA
ncbi:MAG: restriction endonuclease [Alphaproteobacteria bacterium]|nr:restriction endonuclease [Alphaproteobacteria bacterium]